MQNEIKFKVRAYGYCELAQLYFPSISKLSASNQFRKWLKINDDLKTELAKSGLLPKQKIFTPKQVDIIISYLGAP